MRLKSHTLFEEVQNSSGNDALFLPFHNYYNVEIGSVSISFIDSHHFPSGMPSFVFSNLYHRSASHC
jgi:hypothetical protein